MATESEFRMQAQGIATTREGLVIASGYGLKINVQRGHLVVHDGVGTRRQTRTFNRSAGGLRRLVVLGHDGFVTLDALHWLREVGATFVQLDHHGQPIAESAARGSDNARLRRSQALARDTPAGAAVARYILGEKLDGQAALARQIQDCADVEIRHARDLLEGSHEMADLLAAESAAAGAYWKVWSSVRLPFPKSDVGRLPKHWLTFGQRHSPLTRSTRTAADPANAILNYLYALLEAETTGALQTIGLDPGLGIFHTDKPGRASMSLDVMEASRPVVDAYLLALLTERTLAGRDFIETPRGACRLRPAFAKSLAETSEVWREHVGPVAERVAQLLAHSMDEPLPTKLTQAARSESRAGAGRQSSRPTPRTARVPRACADCGAQLPSQKHRYCERCREQRWGSASAAGRKTAASVLRQLRSEGRDPAHGGTAARDRGRKNARHQAAVRAWDAQRQTAFDAGDFAEIVAALRRVPVGELMQATGLSQAYCSLIRLGKRTPHQRHWAALRALADQQR